MKRRILEHFGVSDKAVFMSELFGVYRTDICNAVRDNQLLAIIGERGAGKTTLFNDALARLKSNPDRQPVLVYVRNKDRERLKIGHIISAIIFDISSESPRRDMEARSRQVIRLLGEKVVNEGRHVCVIIENAHRLHGNTIMAIKDLREDGFAGVAPLFSVVLLGHDQLKAKLKAKSEVFWRSELVEMNEGSGWMLFADRVRFLKVVYGEAITAKARNRIATLYKVPLALEYFVERKMDEAFKAGMKQLTGECFEASAMEIKEALDVSLQEIAEEAGIGKTTAHDVLHGKNEAKKSAVNSALERLAEKKRQQEDAAQMRKVA